MFLCFGYTVGYKDWKKFDVVFDVFQNSFWVCPKENTVYIYFSYYKWNIQ